MQSNPPDGLNDELEMIKNENKFIENWLLDLLDTMERELDRETSVRLIGGCGKGCFNRHQFKQDIANDGKGNINELIEVYKRNFEIWQDGDTVQTIFETAMDRPFKVEILESLRRGGKTCHFLVHLA